MSDRAIQVMKIVISDRALSLKPFICIHSNIKIDVALVSIGSTGKFSTT